MSNDEKPPAVLFLHAHPDDECILTGATLAKASHLGVRTIVVYGTKGDAGETSADLGDQTLGERRVDEAMAACADLGVARVEWLAYADSGMAGTETTADPQSFSKADPASVAEQLAELLADERIVAVVGYDENGTYGHPDHIQVHRVANAAVTALDAPWVLDATYNREYLASLPGGDGSLDPSFAAAEADLTHFVAGEAWLQAKITAVSNHLSQVPDDWDADNPDLEGFRARFGTEWFIARAPGGATDLGPLAEVLMAKHLWADPTVGTSSSSRGGI
ncbi:MAG: PIG-L family deacetylase [Acidimicrobiales bacterium]